MKKGFIKLEMFISDFETDPKEYINLPVMKGDKVIGVVSEAYFENWVGTKLILTIFADIEYVRDKDSVKASAIILG